MQENIISLKEVVNEKRESRGCLVKLEIKFDQQAWTIVHYCIVSLWNISLIILVQIVTTKLKAISVTLYTLPSVL